jgi:hypothetical protein
MKVLGALLEGREYADGRPALLETGVVDVEEEGEVALDYKRLTVGHNRVSIQLRGHGSQARGVFLSALLGEIE